MNILRRSARIVVALGLIAAGVAVVWFQETLRSGEVSLAHQWIGVIVDGPVRRVDDVLQFTWVDGPIVGLKLGVVCAVALLVAPLLAAGAFMLGFGRVAAIRVILAMVLGAMVLIAVNQIRIVFLAVALQRGGMDAFEFNHEFVAAIFAVVGFVIALLVVVKVASGGDRPTPIDV